MYESLRDIGDLGKWCKFLGYGIVRARRGNCGSSVDNNASVAFLIYLDVSRCSSFCPVHDGQTLHEET